jgi:hypothetical protein
MLAGQNKMLLALPHVMTLLKSVKKGDTTREVNVELHILNYSE